MSGATEQTRPYDLEASRSELAAAAALYVRSLDRRLAVLDAWRAAKAPELPMAAPPMGTDENEDATAAEVEQVISAMFADFEPRLAAVHRTLDRVLDAGSIR